MKVIIAGSRTISRYELVSHAVYESGFQVDEVVSGHAPEGVDMLGEQWAVIHKVKAKVFPANWRDHGKRAGIYRNAQMAEYADALIAVWDGQSPGTDNMIDTMKQMGKPVFMVCQSGNQRIVTRSKGCPRACQARNAGLREPEDCGPACTAEQCRVQ